MTNYLTEDTINILKDEINHKVGDKVLVPAPHEYYYVFATKIIQ